MKVSLQRTRTFRIPDPSVTADANVDLVVWWYGPLVKNHRAQSVPKVVVFFRELGADGSLGRIVRRETALTHLGLLRIGSVWNKGISKALIDLPTVTFDVSFSSGGWRIISPYGAVHDERRSNPIPADDYPLKFSPDKNHLLDFSLADDRNLVIPCMEFFVRYYGRSEEVPRVLATYPWEEVQKRLFKPFDQPIRQGTWPVKLAKRMRNGDTVFLAHVLHDPYARKLAKSIYGQIESAFQAEAPYVFLKVAPWFRGATRVKVAGIPIDGGRTFLGLRVVGGSGPLGDTIHRDRDRPGNAGGVEPPLPGHDHGGGLSLRSLTRLPDILDLTDDEEPDHGSSSLDIQEEDFEELGEPRVIVDVQRANQGKSGGRPHGKGEEITFSTGEPHGSGKGVGYASIHACAVLESHGTLRDMWSAVLYLKTCKPDAVKAVEWFTFEDGFKDDPEPKLIAFEPFEEDEEGLDAETTRWPYYDPGLEVLRGALVIRVTVLGEPLYLFEIQRRPVRKKDGLGNFKDGEESFKGLVFRVDGQERLVPWLRTLMNETRRVKGVVARLTGLCAGLADSFKHAPSKDQQRPCEAAVRNALRKVGVEI
ncbi:hypothetical protein [Thauera phenylacetica]|uniref:hypothetical protein n=1 Tax=Thauera phenylacetica TaxID=164400 RepID=UPI0039E59CAE